MLVSVRKSAGRSSAVGCLQATCSTSLPPFYMHGTGALVGVAHARQLTEQSVTDDLELLIAAMAREAAHRLSCSSRSTLPSLLPNIALPPG